MKCECGKDFETEKKLKAHSNNCYTHRAVLRKLLDNVVSKEFLLEMICKNGFPVLYIANEILKNYPEITNGHIYIQAKKYGIKTPSLKDSSNSKVTRDKFKKTCIAKFGAENPLSFGTISFEKRNKTVLDKYGVKNVFQDETIKNKIKQKIIDIYGVDNPTKINGVRKNVGNTSFLHRVVEKWLIEKGFNFESEREEKKLVMYNEHLKRVYKPRPDIIIPNLNLIIEIYGDRWHANPSKYKKADLIFTWSGELTAEQIWEKNKIREKHLNNCGFKVFVLWGYDIKNNASTKIKDKLILEIEKWEKILKSQKLKKSKMKIDTIYL